MYVRTYAECAYVCEHVGVYVCMYVYAHVSVYAYLGAQVYAVSVCVDAACIIRRLVYMLSNTHV